MSTQYAEEWPVPAPTEQPPNRPLPTRRVDAREYECGLVFNPPPSTSASRSYSCLPEGFAGKFDLSPTPTSPTSSSPTGHFADARFDADDTWLRVRVDIPFRAVLVDARRLPQYEDHPLPTLRPSARGPILTVRHSLEIALACAYGSPELEGEGGESAAAVEELKFTIPLTFVRVQQSHGPRVEPVAGDVRARAERMRSLPYAQPAAALSLPAYNTLYHKNGVRREDPTPLPVYTKDEGVEHPPEAALSQARGVEFAGQQRVDEERPALTICKQTPLHKVATVCARS